MDKDTHLPTLSPYGWVTNKQTMLEKAYSYYLTSYYRQSTMFAGNVKSLERSIMSKKDPSDIRDQIVADFTELLSAYFEHRDITVTATLKELNKEEIDKKLRNIVIIDLDVTIDDSETGKIYRLTEMLYTENSRLLYMETMRARVSQYTDTEGRTI